MKYITSRLIYKCLFIIFFVSLLCFLITLNEFKADLQYLSMHPNYGLYFFYNVFNSGVNLVPSLVLTLLIPNIFIVDLVQEIKNNFSNFIISRIGYKKHQIISTLTNLSLTFVVYFFIILLVYIYSHLFFKIDFNNLMITENESSSMLITGIINDPLKNVILFILFTSFGYAVLSTFLLSLGKLINNLYVVRISGVLYYVFCTMGSAIVASTISNSVFLTYYILTPLVPINLLSCGISSFGNSLDYLPFYVIYLLSVLYYSTISIILMMKLWRNR